MSTDKPFKGNPTMVERLRTRFITTAMGALLIILLLLLGFINLSALYRSHKDLAVSVQTLLDNDGRLPLPEPGLQGPGRDAGTEPAPQAPDREKNTDPRLRKNDFAYNRQVEAPFRVRYFTVWLDREGKASRTLMDQIASISQDQAVALAEEVAAGKKTGGYADGYRFGIKETTEGFIAVFADASEMLSSAQYLLIISLVIGAAALAMMFVLVYVLAGRAIAPVAESIEKQRQFISDAGHELKTPLSVISANLDVIELTGEKNEWTGSIRGQIKRMTTLINNMLTLSRMEEEQGRELYADVDFSAVAEEIGMTYETVALSHEKTLVMRVEKGLHVFGEERSLGQLVTLLLDNAVKYSSEEAVIRAELFYEQRSRKIIWQVTNPTDQMPTGDLSRLFDRFYRADPSRNSQTGGHGIGLSVAKAVCENHGGRIEAVPAGDQSICFRAILPPLHKNKQP